MTALPFPMATVRAGKAASVKDRKLRDSMYPDAEERRWQREGNFGFATIPKTFPQLFRIMDRMSKGAPLSATYLALWCYTWDNGFARLSNHQELAIAAGFDGQRAVRTWQERMRKLQELGFVEIKEGHGQEFGYAFIPNPHAVLIAHHRNKTAHIVESDYNDFLARASDVRAKDVEELLSPVPAAVAPAAVADPAVPPPPGPAAASPTMKSVNDVKLGRKSLPTPRRIRKPAK